MRKRLLILSLSATGLLPTPGILQAQKIADPRPFANTITAQDLRQHLYIVAGRDFEGRETGSEGQRKAAAYIEAHFKSLGLAPGNKDNYQLQYPIFRDSLREASIEVNGQSFTLNQDFWILVSNNHTETLMGSEVVFAGYGISDSTRDDYKGLNITGKIVLLLNGTPPGQKGGNPRNSGFFAKMAAARKNGAAAVLVIRPNFPAQAFGGGRTGMYVDAFQKTIPLNSYYVNEKIATAIMGDEDYKAAAAGNPVGKTYTVNIMASLAKSVEQIHSSDVLGFLEGTDLKDQLVVISAHYDHLGRRDTVIYYGADDDGSGTVSVLELAQAFAKAKEAGKGPRRSILFLANSGEEEGLWGSEYYSEHPTYPLDKTTVDLNIDMIGRIDPNRKKGDSTNYVYVVGDDKLSSDLKPISEAQNKKYTKLELDYKFNDPKDPERIYYRSDHFNFARKGVPIIFYFDGIHKDYHRPSDTPDKINYDILEKRARLVFYTAWEMANRNDMLKRDIPLN